MNSCLHDANQLMQIIIKRGEIVAEILCAQLPHLLSNIGSENIMKTLKSLSGLLLLFMSFSMWRITESTSYMSSIMDCPFPVNYSGPPDFEDIFKGIPTRPPNSSENQGADLVEGMISISLGEFPAIGSLIKGFFDTFMGIYKNKNLDNMMNTFYEDLETEVRNLQLYVDEQIAELTVTFIEANLGQNLIYLQHCTLEGNDTAGMMECNKEAYRRIVSSKVFLPKINDSELPDAFSERELRNQAVVLERILPMLRHYGDSLILSASEVISGHYQNNQTDIARNYELDLRSELTELISYLQRCQSLIELYSIANYEWTECDACPGQSIVPPWNTVEDYYVKVRISSTFGPGGTECVLKAYESTPGSRHVDKEKAQDPMPLFKDSFGNYVDVWHNFKDTTLPQVRKYYDTMFGRTLDNWNAVLENIQSGASGSLHTRNTCTESSCKDSASSTRTEGKKSFQTKAGTESHSSFPEECLKDDNLCPCLHSDHEKPSCAFKYCLEDSFVDYCYYMDTPE